MLTDSQKLTMIRSICDHPDAFHWTGRQMADAITRVIIGNETIQYALSDEDAPIPYELAHDAVYEDSEDYW